MTSVILQETLAQYLTQYGYVAVFLLSLVEGPIVTIVAAFLAAQGLLSLPIVFGVVILGDLVGDTAYYGIGRWCQIPLQRFLSHRQSTMNCRIERVSARIRAQPGRVLLFGKLTHATGFAILLAAGAAGIRLREFFLYCLLGTLPKAVLLTAVGYFFGEYYQRLDGPLQWGSVILFVLLIGIIVYVLHRWNVGSDVCPEEK